jgi:hypothetical protein
VVIVTVHNAPYGSGSWVLDEEPVAMEPPTARNPGAGRILVSRHPKVNPDRQ